MQKEKPHIPGGVEVPLQLRPLMCIILKVAEIGDHHGVYTVHISDRQTCISQHH